MYNIEQTILKNMIKESEAVAFDFIDTLLISMTNSPEVVFDLVGEHFELRGFRRIRTAAQEEAYKAGEYNVDSIYGLLEQNVDFTVDWEEVKQYELQVERDNYVSNDEMYAMYEYAKELGKRIIAVTDSYWPVDLIQTILNQNGYKNIDEICKINGIEQLPYTNVLYVGKNKSLANQTFYYQMHAKLEHIEKIADSDVDKGLFKILCNNDDEFWYNHGVEVGGPLFMGLFLWLEEKIKKTEKRIFFLSKTSFTMFMIFKNMGYENIEYLYFPTDEETDTELYEKYLHETGYFDDENIVFDMGFDGSRQQYLADLKQRNGCEYKDYFYYFGLLNDVETHKNMHGKLYDAYAFYFYNAYSLQSIVRRDLEVVSRIFSVPGKDTLKNEKEHYRVDFDFSDENGKSLIGGIVDFVKTGYEFVQKYQIEFTPETAMGHLKRLLFQPDEEEIRLLGCQRPEPVPEEKYHLEGDGAIRNYNIWRQIQREKQTVTKKLEYQPMFSFVIPVYNVTTPQLTEAIDSVLAQTYTNFELILVDDHSSWENVVPTLQTYENRDKVHIIYRQVNGNISEATNDGIRTSQGDYIVFMDCDDTVEPDALYEMACKLNENPQLDFIYSDEDKVTEDGKIYHYPFFKPDWSPDLFMSMMYTNHLGVYRASIVKEIGGLRSAYNGSQDYDMTLRFLEHSDNSRVGHVAKVLYHWRERKESVAFALSSKNYAAEAARYAKLDAIKRRGWRAHLEYVPQNAQYLVVHEIMGSPLVSIVIPSKDHPDILKRCIDSLLLKTAYKNIEIIVVDNGSNDANYKVISDYSQDKKITYLYDRFEFNFSKMCNIGARQARGEYLLFLNDDVEIIQPQWLEVMLGSASQPKIGAVGAKLYYPNSILIQHAGVANIQTGPSHNFLRTDDSQAMYYGLNWVNYDVIAVTGACLLVNTQKFYHVGMFDEKLAVAYNDVDVCFRLWEAGYYNLVCNNVILYHYESLSRGNDAMNEQKFLRLSRERNMLYDKHKNLKSKDPFLNENLFLFERVFDMKEMNMPVEKTEIEVETEYFPGHIDCIGRERDYIRIIGWAAVNEQAWSRQVSEGYLLFKDPYGLIRKAKLSSFDRADIPQVFGGKNDYLEAGMETCVAPEYFRSDLFSYEIGVLLNMQDGTRKLRWLEDKSDVSGLQSILHCCNEHRIIDVVPREDDSGAAVWYIDECSRQNGCYRIQGWAYYAGNQHYQYVTKIVVTDGKAESFEFDVTPVERIDVAKARPSMHYLWNVGFDCMIADFLLDKDKEYQVWLRFCHISDAADVHDVETGRKLDR